MSRSILMLENDDDDRYITQAVFDEHRYDIKIHFVSTSQEVFTHLLQCEKNHVPFPSLILLDYHAIPSNAVDILNELKSGSKYNHIPVVVLSGTVKNEIIKECYTAGASSFIQKPDKVTETDAKISSFFQYWFKTVELP
jgi:response regulator RpfG family c-di-GMP phosphodiesterase